MSDVRKVQIAVEFGSGPDLADFDAAVIRRVAKGKVRLLAVLKKTGLVVFDGEVVMSFTLADQIIGDLALGQQGIGGNLFALNIDGIQ